MRLLMKYYAVVHRPIGQDGMSTWWLGAEDRQALIFPRNEVIVDLWQQAGGVRMEIFGNNSITHRVVAIPIKTKIKNRKRFLETLLPQVWLRTPVIV